MSDKDHLKVKAIDAVIAGHTLFLYRYPKSQTTQPYSAIKSMISPTVPARTIIEWVEYRPPTQFSLYRLHLDIKEIGLARALELIDLIDEEIL